MANANYYSGYVDTPYVINTVTTTVDNTTATPGYEQAVRLATNNWPLCQQDPNCSGNTGTTQVTVDPTLPQTTPSGTDLTARTYGVTFESIRQNIASYNYHTDLNDIKHLIRTYYLENNKTITEDVDMRTTGYVYTRLTGDTGYPNTLIKTTQYTGNRIFNTTYGIE